MTGLASVRVLRFQQFQANGTLTVFPGSPGPGVPFEIKRVFSIADVPPGDWRADHAHHRCSQLHVCLSGHVEVRLSDGRLDATHMLQPDGTGLLVPPLVWNRVRFADRSTVLIVFCDEPYDETDYIRDWQSFVDIAARAGA